mgnify:CR=1 FL=1
MVKKDKKIIIADDEKDILSIYHDKFSLSGFDVVSTDKGKAVFDLAVKHQPDIILLDIMMIDTDGYKVVKKLKTTQKTKNIPVIMLSNLGHGEAIAKGILNGADDYIVKVNYTPQEIVEKINIFLQGD